MKIVTFCMGVILLQSCFHSNDDSIDSSPVNGASYTQNDLGQYTDSSGDATFDFIDLESMIITIDESIIKVEIILLNLPAEFPYNQVNTPNNALEYGWRVYFDVDLDSTKANDVSFSINSFKSSDSSEALGELLVFTQQNVWLGSIDGSAFSVIPGVNLSSGIDGLKLTMSVLKDSDSSISKINLKTPVRFEAVTNVSGVVYVDAYPDI